MYIHRIINSVFTSNTYILTSEGKSAFLIDIGDVQPVKELLDFFFFGVRRSCGDAWSDVHDVVFMDFKKERLRQNGSRTVERALAVI